MTNPPTNQVAPHSCADICSRKRNTCSHSCPLPCHPGPCPPCQVALVVPCPSHNYPLTVKCHMSSNKSTSMTPVCGTDCGRELPCGNMDHMCDSPCHYGPCRPCEVLETVRCYCGNHSKQEACGWNKDNGQHYLSASRFSYLMRLTTRLHSCRPQLFISSDPCKPRPDPLSQSFANPFTGHLAQTLFHPLSQYITAHHKLRLSTSTRPNHLFMTRGT